MTDAPDCELKLDDQLCFALYAATNAITRAYRPLLGGIGLTYPQYLVMLTLWQDGPVTSGRIAERLKLGANAITPLVDQLETAGFVERRRDASDRRIVVVVPTAEGRDLATAASAARADIACRIGLSPDEAEALRGSLNALVDRMGKD